MNKMSMIRRGIFCKILASLMVAGFVAGFVHSTGVTAEEETMRLLVGESKIIPARVPIRIVIGNPKIVDVSTVTDSEITITGKGQGKTKLVYWDAFGEQSLTLRVLNDDIIELKNRIDNLLAKLDSPEVYTKEDEDEGKVLLLGRVKTAQEKERISTALGSMKEKTLDLIEIKEEEAVVDIDVQILELDQGATNTLGFTWPSSLTIEEMGSPGIPGMGAVAVTTGTAGSSASYSATNSGTLWGTLFQVARVSRSAFVLSIDALVQEGKARILSRPRLSCQSGKEAQLLVGGEKPTFTTSTTEGGSSSSTVEYKEYGIKLKIRPNVTRGDRIKLALNVEVSDIGEAITIGSTTLTTGLAYPLTKRTASTELFLNDGQTMAIGGLIKKKTEEELRKFPWLADVPVLGAFFRKKISSTGKGSAVKDDTELFITLTPVIVSREPPQVRRDMDAKKPASSKKSATVLAPVVAKPIPENYSSYAGAVQTKITKAIYYPKQAKDAGWEGNVKLNLNITYNGVLKEATVLLSSGYKVLDDAALEVARNQAPYPPFPPQIESEELWVEVPIVYKK